MDKIKIQYPLDIIEINQEEAKEITTYFKGLPSGFISIGPMGHVFPKYETIMEQLSYYYYMPVHGSDIFVAAFPRSGTTMTQELVWLIKNDLDYDTASSKYLCERYISIRTYGESGLAKAMKSGQYQHLKKRDIKKIQGMTWPIEMTNSDNRFFMTHLPFCMLPPNTLDTAKVVYVARNPLDVAVSVYHFSKKFKMYEFVGDFKTFWYLFTRNLTTWTPYFGHVKQAWEKRHHPNMLFQFYGDITKDLPAAIRRISTFLNKSYSDEQIKGLCEHMKFENFQKNESVNLNFLKEFDVYVPFEQPFIRKGKTGGWQDYFDEELTKHAVSWIEENLRDTDLRFPELEVLLKYSWINQDNPHTSV